MKWNTTDCQGNPKTWYSADVIEKIKDICKRKPYQAIIKIEQIIKNEEK